MQIYPYYPGADKFNALQSDSFNNFVLYSQF